MDIKRLLTSVFGLGWLPKAPGTWGSIPSVIIFALACHYAGTSTSVLIAMGITIFLSSIVCVQCSPSVIKWTGKKDPGEIVADETAGQALTFLAAAFFSIETFDNAHIFMTAILGFLLFRIFDIAKPWPIRKLEKYPDGWGILLDDLLAGVLAGVVLFFCRYKVLDFMCGMLFPSEGTPLGVFHAIVLGVIQGATEFLPVSSSGHLVLFENIFQFNPEMPEMLMFDLCVHVGTLAAIFYFFRESMVNFVKNLLASKKYGSKPIEIYKKSPSVHILVLAILVTGITGVFGVLLMKLFEEARGSLMVVSLMWFITGTLLIVTDMRKKSRIGLRQFGILAAIIVALAQSAAIMPGISRSGATICAAILVGLHRKWAVEFSFLIAIPAILGAAVITLIKDYSVIQESTLPMCSVLAGVVAAAITGVFALKLLIKTSRGTKLKYFAYYCYALAFIVLIFNLK
ncbi:MAG: phosphatidylglycerophosphatase A [Sedimentisphaerales bacterium]|nr:phosphatidylglycerophosphatase A [Sedimentisphaerales bacterium]